jgi:V/A-type H+-transporting ATPase subunit A
MDSRVVAVNGPLVTVEIVKAQEVMMNEVAYVLWNSVPLKSEVIRIRGRLVDMQVFENTVGLKVGDQVDFAGNLLSATLGPGMLGQIYDGLQNPLSELENDQGYFLRRGQYVSSLNQEKKWEFTPSVKPGDTVKAGYYLGSVPEGIFEHHIMVPFLSRGFGRWWM